MAKICVYSTFYGLPDFTKNSILNHLSYCNYHGYIYKPYLFNKPTPRQFSWAKIFLGIELLKTKQYDAIFWMDADSWFLDTSFSLDEWLIDIEPIQFAGDENDIFNGGHFLLKSVPESIVWLEACWQICYTQDPAFVTTHKDSDHLFDQPGILAVLGGANPSLPHTWATGFNAVNGYPGNPLRLHHNFQAMYAPIDLNRSIAARNLICERWRPYCLIRPQNTMNTYPWALGDKDFIIHFVGNSKQLMHEWKSNFRFYPN